ncbi:rod shape-determining protein MreD [Algoriphagus boritolerans]|uniref:Rod shape-determining protein MreD n=1 Tax=Algoriphagus boritolerans DSM 17298 = JCM 18970 TaxID=1120964 RepID=A0A1H5SSU7_9BACT|nr:rod shape-determining protein MreD [Algoriphagus boritolerans]SEF53018.1 rod shape-determining protein MreD [Algoriphagus boritolerans DSM 17298 = JCM 18970]
MNIRNLFSFVLLIIFLGVIQILFLKNLALFGVAFVFIYLLGILLLPISVKTSPLLFLAFFLGLMIDVFYETIGMHAAAATCLAFFRSLWLRVISPTGGYVDTEEPSLNEMGLVWFLTYSFPLIFVYSLVFFIADQWGTSGFLGVLNKSFFSSILTCLLAILVQLLFFKRRRGI